MANNLRKFDNEAAYSAATLNYPAVSWVVSGDTVHFDKEEPTVNDKVMIALTSNYTGNSEFVLWNGGYSDWWRLLNGMTINNVAIEDPQYTYSINYYTVSGTDYVIKYDITWPQATFARIDEYFSGNLGGGWGSDTLSIDFFVPSKYEQINSLPANTANLVIEATTPPTITLQSSDVNGNIYVPDDVVNTYKSSWSDFASDIYPISEYNGALPI